MPITTAPTHTWDQRPDTTQAPGTIQSAFEPRTSPQLDLRIVAFMVFLAVVQLLTFKRPFS